MHQSTLGPRDWFDISAFVSVVRAGGFTEAARLTRSSPSTASRAVRRLEGRLGVQLLHRTTRSMSLTEAGRSYFDQVAHGLGEVDAAERSVAEGVGTARGVLRLVAPATFSRTILAPILARFMLENPTIELDASFSEYSSDVVAEGIDVAIRMGKPSRGGVLIKKLARNRRVACASPQYLAERGEPLRPEDLRNHKCLSYKRHGTEGWGFSTRRGETTITLSSTLRADSGEVLRAAALEGLGVAYLPWFLVADDVATRRLEVVLEKYEAHANWLYAAYTESVRRAPKVTAFVAHLQREFAQRIV
jgi:DNA-binding transcriptional LysR family regulator